MRRAAVAAPARDGANVLPGDIAAQVHRIQVRARRLAASALPGDYRSVFRGSGIEFAEAREYAPGDDVRLIDWNVTARMGTPWVKQYVEERELPVVCAVDISPSQWVGRPARGRLGLAAELTALLSLAAANQNDRSGLLLFSDRIHRFVPPARGSRHAIRLVREVLAAPRGEGGADVGTAADYLARVLGRRSVVFLITDGLTSGFETSLRLLARRHEVIALTLTDPNDFALPDLGLVELEDAELGARILLDSGSAEVRRLYGEAAQKQAAARRAAFVASGVDEIELATGADYVTPIVRYLRYRAARR